MLRRAFAPAKPQEHACWHCALPRATPNSSKPARTGLSMTATTAGARAQDKDAKPAEKPAETAAAAPPKEESSVTDHIIKLGGQTIPYKATAATILLKNEKDEPTALVYYTAYTRSDAKDLSQRPIAFV